MDEGELSTLYAGVDIFALPTVGEGFGLPILEAMACGVPVVVPDISSHPDFVREGGGMLVDIGYNICEIHSSYYRGYPDLDDYLTKLLLLVDDPGLRRTLGIAGRATALKYDWDKIAESWRTLINKHVGEARATKRWQRLTTV
jgi:glycosyltransferase involved in cell wall biosynthesis